MQVTDVSTALIGRRVRLLVPTMGDDEQGDERRYEAGATGEILAVDRYAAPQGHAVTVGIEGEIVNVFDEGDGPGPFFELLEG